MNDEMTHPHPGSRYSKLQELEPYSYGESPLSVNTLHGRDVLLERLIRYHPEKMEI